MRLMYILRGSPASGKSTWIRENHLESYTLAADSIRLLYEAPVLNNAGNFCITQKNDTEVWALLMKLLEKRMSNGEFVIVDATHYKSTLINKYKNLVEKYRYRVNVVDFTDVPMEELLKRNAQREEYKRVPEETIRKMNAVFEQDKEVNARYEVLTREQAIEKLHGNLLFDFNKYEKIVVFGDIHGCYEPLKNYFEQNPFNENYSYIFVGDYLDRGIQNKEVLEFLFSIKDKKNVLLLEGNHEKHLRRYAEDDYIKIDKVDRPILEKYCDKVFFRELQERTIRSREFIDKTVPQIESIDKKDLRQLCRKFGQFAYFTFKGKEYFICHGGIPIKPNIFVSTKELIKGTGGYTELDELYNAWNNNVKDCVLIHGHRNVFGIDTKVNENIYNLCSGIEIGEPLRILEIGDTIEVKLVPNTVFDKNCHFDKTEQIDFKDIKSDNEIIDSLNKSKLIKKKLLNGGIISYNFNRDAFYSRKWNELTCTARGLFVDLKTQKVIARAYSKFFNWSEVKATESATLKQNLNFPVKAYRKENGFLALVSYNWNNDALLVCSKSTNDGDYVGYIRQQLAKKTEDEIDKLKEYLKVSGSTLVFECVDIVNDPHIIKYDESELFLLDEIKNSFVFEKASYERLQDIAKALNFKYKHLEYTFDTWEELYAFKKQQDISYTTRHEGWVFEDVKGFMVKYKTRYYKFWKMMRAVKENIIKGAAVKKTFTSEDEVRVYTMLRELGAEKLSNMSMIEIEDMYYGQQK